MRVELLAELHATFWGRLPRDGHGPMGWLYTPSGDVTSLLTGSLMHTSIKRLAERTTIPVANGSFVADNYRAKLEADGADANLRKIFFGMGSLSLGELAGERMKVALEANSTEDEHDCFSDNTHHTLYFNAEGIRNIYLGEYKRVDGSVVKGPSVADLVAKADAQANTDLKADLDATQAKMQAIVDRAEKDGVHFDQMIAPADEADHKIISDAIASLVKQTGAIEKAAAALGIQDLKPDNADHQF